MYMLSISFGMIFVNTNKKFYITFFIEKGYYIKPDVAALYNLNDISLFEIPYVLFSPALSL